MSTLGIGGPPSPADAPAATPPPALARPPFKERLRRWLLAPEYPLAAIEVRPHSVGAVRVQKERGRPVLGAAASLSLPEGTLVVSMGQANIASIDAFRETLRSVLERAGIPLHGAVGLVLPDPVARVSLVPVAELAGKDPGEIEEVIRFRMRKAVPFDVKEARVACHVPRTGASDAMAVAVVIARPVIEGYEEAIHSLGLTPGVVELSCLTILTAIEVSRPPGDRLIVNWDDGYVSLILTRAGEPVLVRTLTGEAASTHEDIVREVANTVLYYREKLGGAGLASVVVRSAVLAPGQAIELLREPVGTRPEILDLWSSPEDATAAASQAVAGAAACVVGKLV